MAISADIFSRCSPAIGNNINECGAVTLCDVITAQSGELHEIFTDANGAYRDMNALLATQFEIKACGTRINGLFDFLMSNKKMVNTRKITVPLGLGGAEIMPFIMAMQHSIINAEYWSVPSLEVSGNTYTIHARSRANIPLDERWFVPGMNVYISARSAGGTALRGAFLVVSSAASTFGGNATIRITATGQNTTLGASAKAAFTGSLSAGVLVRGSANVNDTEQWCYNRPALNDRKHVPFWFETDRYSLCTDQYYQAYYKRLQEGNQYFKLFGDVDSAQRNKQLADIWQREWLNKFFWGKPISANQTLANYRSLQQVTSFAGTAPYGPYIQDQGRCIGYKANSIGVYEQLAECGQVFDLQNQRLNLEEIFKSLILPLYNARTDSGKPSDTIEIFTDSYTASVIQRGMIGYYDNQARGLFRFNLESGKLMNGTMGSMGFTFNEYNLVYPQVKLRVVSNRYFDDYATAHTAENIDSSGRFLWILDFTSIYPAIIASNRVTRTTDEIEKLAAVDRDFACVMANPTRDITMNSLTWATVVECPATSAIVENFSIDLDARYIADYPTGGGDLYSA